MKTPYKLLTLLPCAVLSLLPLRAPAQGVVVIYYPQTGHYYDTTWVDQGITWDDAKAAAEARGGHLATINSLDEFWFILSNLKHYPDPEDPLHPHPEDIGYWLGGFQPGDTDELDADPAAGWAWVTGEPFDQTLWDTLGSPHNQPDDNEAQWYSDLPVYREDAIVIGSRNLWYDFMRDPPLNGSPQVHGYVIEFEKPPVWFGMVVGTRKPVELPDNAELWIDGRLCVSYPNDAVHRAILYTTMVLAPGWHDIRIVYEARAIEQTLYLQAKYANDISLMPVPRSDLRYLVSPGVYQEGLKAEYSDTINDPFTVYGEGPIDHGCWEGIPYYQRDYAIENRPWEYVNWGNVYPCDSKFTETLTGQIYIYDDSRISCPGYWSMIFNADPGSCGATIYFPWHDVYDVYGPWRDVTCVPPSGSIFPLGETIVTCTSHSVAGTSQSCAFILTVNGNGTPDPDMTSPTISCPANISVAAASAAGTPVTFSATATDNCNSAPPFACVPPSGTKFSIGTTTVTCTASDAAGNQSTCGFTISVQGPRPMKTQVCNDLIALRDRVKTDWTKFNAAINYVNKSLESKRWLDNVHPKPGADGEGVFSNEKSAVSQLVSLKPKYPAVQSFIEVLVRADQIIAQIAINEAIARNGNATKINAAKNYFKKGDIDAAANKPTNAIDDYKNAWKNALGA